MTPFDHWIAGLLLGLLIGALASLALAGGRVSRDNAQLVSALKAIKKQRCGGYRQRVTRDKTLEAAIVALNGESIHADAKRWLPEPETK